MTVARYDGIAEDRQQLRLLIDQRKRERVEATKGQRHLHCRGCGGTVDTYTDGCPQCRNRRNSHRSRAGLSERCDPPGGDGQAAIPAGHHAPLTEPGGPS